MATEYKRIQQMTGAYADLDKTQMLIGEMAVPNDHAPIIRTSATQWFNFLCSEDEDVITDMQGDIQELQDGLSSTNITINNLAMRLNNDEKNISKLLTTQTATVISENGSGSMVTVNDSSSNALLDVELVGKCAQKGIPTPDYPQAIECVGDSYNELNNTATTQTVKGVTFTVDADKSVSANGTAADSIYYKIASEVMPAGEYKLSGCTDGGNGKWGIGYYKDATNSVMNYSGETDFTQGTSASSFGTYIIIAKGNTLTNQVFKPMIRKADVDSSSYRPYGVNQVVTTSVNKNLFVPTMATATSNNVTCTNNGDGTYTLNTGTGGATADTNFYLISDITKLRDKILYKNIAVSGCPAGGSTSSYCLNLSNFDGAWSPALDTGSGKSIYFKNVSGSFSFLIFIKSGTVCNGLVFKPQIEYGTVATPYEQHTEIVATVPLTEPLCAVGTVQDTVDLKANKFIKKIGKYVFTGNETWASGDNKFYYTSALVNLINKNTKNLMSTMFTFADNATTYTNTDNTMINDNGWINVHCEKATSADSLKALITGMTVYYEADEILAGPLSNAQKTALSSLKSYKGTTNVYTDDIGDVGIEYIADTKLYIDNKFAELQTAMLTSTTEATAVTEVVDEVSDDVLPTATE